MGRRILGSIWPLEAAAEEGKYKVINVAELKHVSPRHMRRCIGKTGRKRPHDLLAKLRLERIFALAAQGKSLKEIADLVGLNYCYLCCLLKKARHQPPDQNTN